MRHRHDRPTNVTGMCSLGMTHSDRPVQKGTNADTALSMARCRRGSQPSGVSRGLRVQPHTSAPNPLPRRLQLPNTSALPPRNHGGRNPPRVSPTSTAETQGLRSTPDNAGEPWAPNRFGVKFKMCPFKAE